MILDLLRHAESAAAAGVAIGQLDVPLTAAGHYAARRRAARWALPPPARIVASDLRRARQTARPFAARFGIVVDPDPRLREAGLGAWEGCYWDQLAVDAGAALAAWYRDWRTEAPPGGESFAAVVDRVGALIADLDADGRTLLIAHAGSIRALLVAAGAADVDAAMSMPLPVLGGYTLSLRDRARPVCAPLPG